jgi:hypothetical protein
MNPPTTENPSGDGATAATSTRPCPVCGTRDPHAPVVLCVHGSPIPSQPRQRYCSPRCRAAAWRRRSQGQPENATPPSANAANVANGGRDVTNDANGERDVTNDANVPNGAATRETSNTHTTQACPHCRQPISLLTLIVPPAAAHVAIPEPPTRRTLRRVT